MRITLLLSFLLFASSLFSQNNYCVAGADSACGNSWIRTFRLSNIAQLEGECDKEIIGPGSDDGYSNYSELVAFMEPGQAYLAEVTVESLVFDEVGIWIDWNNNGEWDFPAEFTPFVGDGFAANLKTAVITPPMDAVAGDTIVGGMRLIGSFLYNYPIIEPCGTDFIAEVEDYSFFVGAQPNGNPGGPSNNNYCQAVVTAVQDTGVCETSFITDFECNNVLVNDGFCDRETANNPSIAIDGYSDYSDQVIQFTTGEQTTATVTVDGNALDFVTGWIDWNNDGTWDNEEIIPFVGEGAATLEFSATILPPDDAVIGTEITGGIRIKNTFLTPATDPCADEQFYEIEDYSFIVLDPNMIQCTAGHMPADSATNVCTNLTFSWDSVPGGASYEFLLLTETNDTVDHIIVPDTAYNPNFDLDATSNYHWKVTPIDTAGVSAFQCDSLYFSTAATAAPSITFNTDTLDVCHFGTLEINPAITPMGGNSSFSWTQDSIFLDDPASASPIFNATETGNYTLNLLVEDENACADSNGVVVQVAATPELIGSGISTNNVCFGEELVFYLETVSDSIQFDFFSLADSSVTKESPLSNSGFDFRFYTEGTHQLQPILFLGQCRDSLKLDTVTFTGELDAPVIDLDLPAVGPCPGDTVSAAVSNYTTGISWNTGSDSLSTFTAQSASLIATYTENTCKKSSEVQVVFDVLPTDRSISADRIADSLCTGDSILVSHAFSNFVWLDGDDSSQVKTYFVDTLVFGTIVTDLGCEVGSDSIAISFTEFPVNTGILFDENRIDSLCEGEVFALQNNDAQITWSTGEQSAEILISETGNYFVISDNGICATSSDTLSIEFGSIPSQPSITVISDALGDSLRSSESASTYRWFLDGTLLAETDRTIAVEVENGAYTLQVVTEKGCESEISDPVVISSIQELTALGVIQRRLNQKEWSWTSKSGNFNIQALTLSGQVLWTATEVWQIQKEISQFTIVKIELNGKVVTAKVLP